MTPTAEEQAYTPTHLAGRTTPLYILLTHNKHPHPLISPGGQHKLHILLTHNYNPWASPPSNQEDWGHLQEDYTGGTPHLHTGGPRYLVIVIYIVSYIV